MDQRLGVALSAIPASPAGSAVPDVERFLRLILPPGGQLPKVRGPIGRRAGPPFIAHSF